VKYLAMVLSLSVLAGHFSLSFFFFLSFCRYTRIFTIVVTPLGALGLLTSLASH
jgi:hypothetical protein